MPDLYFRTSLGFLTENALQGWRGDSWEEVELTIGVKAGSDETIELRVLAKEKSWRGFSIINSLDMKGDKMWGIKDNAQVSGLGDKVNNASVLYDGVGEKIEDGARDRWRSVTSHGCLRCALPKNTWHRWRSGAWNPALLLTTLVSGLVLHLFLIATKAPCGLTTALRWIWFWTCCM